MNNKDKFDHVFWELDDLGKAIAILQNRLNTLEASNATQKGNFEKDCSKEHCGISHREDVLGNQGQVREGQGGQASGSGCLGTKAALQTEQVNTPVWPGTGQPLYGLAGSNLDSWKYECRESTKSHFGPAEAKREGEVYGLPRDLIYYISGPMDGVKDNNFPLFNSVAERLRKAGCSAVNPADISESVGHGKERARYLRADLRALCNCTAILMLPGWETSRGAFFEFYAARELAMPVYYWSSYDSI